MKKSKEHFIHTMEQLKKIDECYREIDDVFRVLSTGFNCSIYPYELFELGVESLIHLYEPYLEPHEDSMIEIFIYEMDWGEIDIALEINDERFDINDLESLWEFLEEANLW